SATSAIAGCQTTCADCAGSSGDLPPPSPPAEKATASEDQAWKASTGDRAGDGSRDVESSLERCRGTEEFRDGQCQHITHQGLTDSSWEGIGYQTYGGPTKCRVGKCEDRRKLAVIGDIRKGHLGAGEIGCVGVCAWIH